MSFASSIGSSRAVARLASVAPLGRLRAGFRDARRGHHPCTARHRRSRDPAWKRANGSPPARARQCGHAACHGPAGPRGGEQRDPAARQRLCSPLILVGGYTYQRESSPTTPPRPTSTTAGSLLICDGEVFMRHATADDDGSFQNLDCHVSRGVVREGRRVVAVTWDDIHHEQRRREHLGRPASARPQPSPSSSSC